MPRLTDKQKQARDSYRKLRALAIHPEVLTSPAAHEKMQAERRKLEAAFSGPRKARERGL